MERQDGQLGFILKTAWDTTGDADEFATGLAQGLKKRFGVTEGDTNAARVLIPDASQPSLIVKRGQEVLLVMGPDPLMLSQTAAGLGF